MEIPYGLLGITLGAGGAIAKFGTFSHEQFFL
jgi:hypothetical protein